MTTWSASRQLSIEGCNNGGTTARRRYGFRNLSALPSARRDTDGGIVANVGIEDLVAMIAIDEDELLDGVTIKLPQATGTYEMLTEAWGKPTDYHAWFNRKGDGERTGTTGRS